MLFSPLVSIVIPVYNGANYLREAIDSALAQTYDNREVLVINDGSRDNGETERIALSYGDKVRYFAKENGGVATALNLGIREMRGEYFSWLSHDDVYLPHKLERQIAFMDQLELHDAVLYCDHAHIDGAGRHIGDNKLPGVPPDSCFEYLYLNSGIHGCTLLIPRAAFDTVGMFPEHLKTTQDYDLWLRMCQKYPFVHQAEILIQGRIHEAQGSRLMPEHEREVQDFHRQFLPVLVEITCADKTPEEAERQRLGLVPQLFSKGHGNLVRKFYSAPERKKESEALRPLFRKLIMLQYLRMCKQQVKQGLRPLWKRLPDSVRNRVKRVKNILMDGHSPTNSLGIQRLDFTDFYLNNSFGAAESLSGGGSSLFQTRIVQRELPVLCNTLHVKTLLDIPCGDFNWMRHVDFEKVQYIGGDIVKDLVRRNQERYGSPQRSFQHLDAIQGPVPQVDLIFCRDCLVHLPFVDALAALRTFRASGATWLLTTTFSERTENKDLENSVWRVLNLRLPPFNLPEPSLLLNEKCTENGGRFVDKCLGLWKIDDLPI